jgi:xanthine dehydrogenase YagS FAD-binding subunit
MKPFSYVRPSSEADAIEAGSKEGARFIAGGTLLVDLLRLEVETPTSLVDVNGLAYGKIEQAPDGLRLGALARNSEVAYHPLVKSGYPVLSEALLSGASPQVRNMASIGGNVLQRTRCPYFRDPAVPACNKRAPGSGCAAMDGFTRPHAVLGVSDKCIATNPSDMCVALVALDAVVHTRGAKGERAISMGDFHVLPGEHPEIETVLQPGEIITHVTLPPSGFAARSAYVKARDRASFAFALASAAVALELQGGTIRQARVALGGVATKPWRSVEAEKALVGQPPTLDAFKRAAAAAVQGARPRKDNAFKVTLAERTVVRALQRVGGVA